LEREDHTTYSHH